MAARYLLSDPDALRRIKFAQFRKQVPPLILLALAIGLNAAFPRNDLYSWALGLALVAIAWFLFIGLCHRFKQRIPLPTEGAILSPIQGRIDFVRGEGGLTLLGIRKVLFDGVEIRSPHGTCHLEDWVLHLASGAERISFRFAFKNIRWFPEADYSAGKIIGMAVGAGSCVVTFPGEPVLAVKPGDPVDAGDLLVEGQTPPELEPEPILEKFPDLNVEDNDT
ncbi:MAG: hypothetical protein K0B87_03620 [Candidatus Syntrophosphaera sp.]|nr:hypothetical protein [Candidatus Syntrophosphaera sp.]